MMGEAHTTRVDDIIDRSAIGAYRLSAFALVLALTLLDGIDNVTLGIAAPVIVQDLGIARTDLALIFTTTLVGLTLGAFGLGYAGDRWGRRPATIACVGFFGLFTLAMPFAQGAASLAALRLLTGIGIGGLLPNACALVTEFAPARYRQSAVLIVSGGLAGGAMLGGVLASIVLPGYGWRALFLTAGGLSVIALVLALAALPESIRFLLARGDRRGRAARILRRIAPGAPPLAAPPPETIRTAPGSAASIRLLFTGGLMPTTLLLWLTYIIVLSSMYLMFQWLPTLSRDVGFSQATAVAASIAFNLGGTIGSLVLGPMSTRWGTYRVAVVDFVLIAPLVVLVAHPGGSTPLLLVAAFAAGWTIMGGLGIVNALAAECYPTPVRSTGIGWGSGMGRLGSSLSPTLVGWLLAAGWGAQDVLQLPVVPALVMAAAVLGIAALNRRRPAPATAQAA